MYRERVAIQEIVCYLTDGRATFFGAQAPTLLFRMHLPQHFASAHLGKVFFSGRWQEESLTITDV